MDQTRKEIVVNSPREASVMFHLPYLRTSMVQWVFSYIAFLADQICCESGGLWICWRCIGK